MSVGVENLVNRTIDTRRRTYITPELVWHYTFSFEDHSNAFILEMRTSWD